MHGTRHHWEEHILLTSSRASEAIGLARATLLCGPFFRSHWTSTAHFHPINQTATSGDILIGSSLGGVDTSQLVGMWCYHCTDSSSGGYRGGGANPAYAPPLTNKDTPPFHCNEFNYMSSATHCCSSCRPVMYHP